MQSTQVHVTMHACFCITRIAGLRVYLEFQRLQAVDRSVGIFLVSLLRVVFRRSPLLLRCVEQCWFWPMRDHQGICPVLHDYLDSRPDNAKQRRGLLPTEANDQGYGSAAIKKLPLGLVSFNVGGKDQCSCIASCSFSLYRG